MEGEGGVTHLSWLQVIHHHALPGGGGGVTHLSCLQVIHHHALPLYVQVLVPMAQSFDVSYSWATKKKNKDEVRWGPWFGQAGGGCGGWGRQRVGRRGASPEGGEHTSEDEVCRVPKLAYYHGGGRRRV